MLGQPGRRSVHRRAQASGHCEPMPVLCICYMHHECHHADTDRHRRRRLVLTLRRASQCQCCSSATYTSHKCHVIMLTSIGTGTAGLFSHFVERVHTIAAGIGRRVIMWGEQPRGMRIDYPPPRLSCCSSALLSSELCADAAFNKGSVPPPKDTVIQMWLAYDRKGGPSSLLQEIVRAGYSAIASPDVPWCESIIRPLAP